MDRRQYDGERRGAYDRRWPRAARLERSARENLLVEAVFFYLYDVGRAVDLSEVSELIPAHPDIGVAKSRDTPTSLTLPKPLILRLGDADCPDLQCEETVSSHAKIYEEGAVTVIIRIKARMPLGELPHLKERVVLSQGKRYTIESFAEAGFRRLFEAVKPAVADPHEPGEMDRESYLAYCVLECEGDPARFLSRNREFCAALLMAESQDSALHESQIEATLGKPFAYREGELAVFDLDRCLIIDPTGDYEDVLLIAEHANYQLLELRVLDG
ncbi:MAG TPA: hypothetical protein VFL04_06425, partial [Rectinemataceae bacterium]|nr:hypothetical protein [Rectinemataceae bacterium]